MNFGNFPPIILLISTHLDFTPSVLSTSHPLIFILIEKQNKTFFVSNKRWWVDISWFSPLTCLTSVFFREPGPGERREGAPCLGARVPGVPSPSLCTTVICHLLTHDPARSCLGFWASVPEPISLPPLAAVAVSAPHTQLMLLWRRLAAMTELLKSVDYEVFGTVQGVCFRMYTEGEAKKRGLVGWVKNTSKGTVTGQVQGPEEKVDAMKSWLSKVGSPSSRIDRADFSNEKTISKLEYSDFSIRY